MSSNIGALKPPGGATLTDIHETPQDLFNLLNEEFGFTLDACALPSNSKCSRFFTPDNNGLVQDWSNEIVWLNPPYSNVTEWIRKAHISSILGAVVVCLVFARTDTKWFHDYVNGHEIRFIDHRLTFGSSRYPSPFPSIVVIMRPEDKDGNSYTYSTVSFKSVVERKRGRRQ